MNQNYVDTDRNNIMKEKRGRSDNEIVVACLQTVFCIVYERNTSGYMDMFCLTWSSFIFELNDESFMIEYRYCYTISIIKFISGSIIYTHMVLIVNAIYFFYQVLLVEHYRHVVGMKFISFIYSIAYCYYKDLQVSQNITTSLCEQLVTAILYGRSLDTLYGYYWTTYIINSR